MFPPTLTTNASNTFSDSLPGASEVCKELGQCRTLPSIVWSCLSVILTCTWLAIHPNVPSPYDTTWDRLRRRLGLTVLGLIAPEMIMFWAAAQWWSARKIKEKLIQLDAPADDANPEDAVSEGIKTWVVRQWRNTIMKLRRWLCGPADIKEYSSTVTVHTGIQWTETHAFFLQMGGFVALRDDSVSYSNATRNFTTIILPPSIDPTWKPPDGLLCVDDADIRKAVSFFTEAEIKDKSKRNDLGKTLVVTQTAWFIVQCIARVAQGLAVTQLEITTVAFAAMNFITYFFWRNKPSDVDCPIRVKIPISQNIILVDAELESSSDSESEPGELNTVLPYTRTFLEKMNPIPIWIHLLLIPLLYSWFIPLLLLRDLLTGARDLLIGVFHSFINVVEGDFEESLQTHCVPTFYYHRLYSGLTDNFEHGGFFAATMFMGSIFGVIHCLAWSEYFPSIAETWLWRSSALVVTLSPFVIADALPSVWTLRILIDVVQQLKTMITNVMPGTRRPDLLSNDTITRAFMLCVMMVPDLSVYQPAMLIYSIARIILLVQAFTLLRSLPLSTYQTVEWTTFIPHI